MKIYVILRNYFTTFSTVCLFRAGELRNPNAQVFGYSVSSQGNWGALSAISSPDGIQINGDI